MSMGEAEGGASAVVFLMHDVTGTGGVARTVISQANQLVKTSPVAVVSLYRRKDAPQLAVDPRIKIVYLAYQVAFEMQANGRRRRRTGPVQPIPGGDRAARDLDQQPSRLADESVEGEMSLLTDRLIERELSKLSGGVLISTRPSLHAAAAAAAPHGTLLIGQEHRDFETRSAKASMLRYLVQTAARLDAFVTLTRADARDWEAQLAGTDTYVTSIPNALPFRHGATSTLAGKTVVAAGRLVPPKGFSRLIQAWGPVSKVAPDWTLRIFGQGELRPSLKAQIEDEGLTETVQLMGHTENLERELEAASVLAMSSIREGFGMVLLEAMSKGVPMVAFDCPRGPGEIVVDGRNGRLVPDGDLHGFSEALLSLITDDDARARMGAAALEDSHLYDPEAIAARWQDLFACLR